MPPVKILCIGDIVGKPGRRAVEDIVPRLKKEKGIDFVVANAENASGGVGLTVEHSQSLFRAGVDVLTCGDHVWDKKDLIPYISMQNTILRPLNFPNGNPGNGYVVLDRPFGQVCVVHLVGRVFMKYFVESPFIQVESLLKDLSNKVKMVIVDMHAEATSEKVAMGWFLDGRASVVFGTHTHVPTADSSILPKGTAYLTDVGMTGPYKSVIGRDIDKILKRFMTQMPVFMDVASEDVRLYGFLVEIDPSTGRSLNAQLISEKLS